MNAGGVSPHLLRVFVYLFRGEAKKIQVRPPPLLHAALISIFSLRAPQSAEAAVWPVFFASPLSLTHAFENVNRARC